MKHKYLAIAVTGLFFCLASSASAIPVTYNFSGSLDGITDNYSLLSGQFNIGDIFHGTFTYETATPEGSTTLPDPTTAIYSAVTSFSVDINGFKIERDSILNGYLQVWDDRVVGTNTVDAFSVGSGLDYTPPISGIGSGTVVAAASVNLFDFGHTASTTGTNIPTLVSLADYTTLSFSALQLNTSTNESFHLDGIISSLSQVTPVPEPTSILLFSIGLAGITGARARKMKKSA